MISSLAWSSKSISSLVNSVPPVDLLAYDILSRAFGAVIDLDPESFFSDLARAIEDRGVLG